jgi:peroxiredoxin
MTREKRQSRPLALAVCAAGLVFLAAVLHVAQSASQPAVLPVARDAMARVGDFALLDHEGKYHQLYRYADSRAVVLFVYGSDCNIARDTLPALKQLREEFADHGDGPPIASRERLADRGFVTKVRERLADWSHGVSMKLRERFGKGNVSFLMIDANSLDDRKTLQKDAARYGIDMPILKDETQLVAGSLDIYRTGEALLIDTRTWRIVYRGPVDDRIYYEVAKAGARQHFLRDAIVALRDGRAVDVAAPSGIGCQVSLGKKTDVSYAKQVAPILTEKCVSCHQAGGIGPWAMDGYDRVKGWSAMMREVLMNRRMPPWHADLAFGTFSNDRSLSGEQVTALVHWIDAGAPRGEGPDPLAGRKAQIPEWPLGEPDVVIDVPEQQIPANGVVDYRYIDIPLPFDRDVWVRAVHLKPSNGAVMHHALAFVRFRPDVEETFFAAYAAGFNVEPFPADSGQFLPKGTALKFQLHYAPVGYATTDRPRLAIYLHKRAPSRELVVGSAWTRDFRIPPYVADQPVEAKFVFGQDALLHSFFPHMHLRGSRVSYEARYPDGRNETLLSVPKYHFNWQSLYSLRTPKSIPAGTEIRVSGAFDNSRSNPANPDPSKEVRYGPQTWDEMFIGYMLYTVPARKVEIRRSASAPAFDESGSIRTTPRSRKPQIQTLVWRAPA